VFSKNTILITHKHFTDNIKVYLKNFLTEEMKRRREFYKENVDEDGTYTNRQHCVVF